MASTYLTFTQQTPTGASAKKFTLSMWVKKCKNGINQGLWGNTYDNTHRGYIYFNTDDKLGWWDSSGPYILTNRMFRDCTGWYHIVWSIDSTQSTAQDRVKLWINGVLETSLDQNTYPSQDNANMKIVGTTNTPYMGKYLEGGTNNYFEGVISHAHFTQGYCYDASTFGETDSSTGEWKIKTTPSVANYGTNGFWWLKDSVATTDHSPNSNAFSVGGGTLTKTEDCPSNVFNVWNMAARLNSTLYIDYGATQAYSDNANWRSLTGTLGASSGKFYYEAMPHSHDYSVHGWVSDNLVNKTTDGGFAFSQLYSYGYKTYSGTVVYNENAGGGSTSYGVNIDPGDVLGCAIDIDNSKVFWAKNGTWLNSADPVNGTNGFSIQSGQTYLPAIAIRSQGGNPTARCNFGNGYFGTTAISSEGTNASGIGKFEYDVPSGYTALSTKGLNE